MGKIRVKTIGDEEQEKVDQKKAEARAAAKKAREEAEARKAAEASDAPEAEKAQEPATTDAPVEDTSASSAQEKKAKKKAKFVKSKKQARSDKYLTVAEKVEKNKVYKLQEALTILPDLKIANFDETVELHINTTETGISGAVTLPHGTGKQVRVAIADASDAKTVEEIVKKIEAGQIDFDVLVATPDAMPKLARVARVLGPKGLMPNPKNGTVTPKPQEVAKKFEGGQMNFKTEAKFPLLHLAVGKVSFGDKKLADNIKAAISAVDSKKIKNVTLKSTMSPAIKLDLASL
ncbi:MAG TPA: 50S ribosomal protein L1 [Patescibacteria group bacterium]|nr:50S ribosomal protein L1 [Patescibacteria group bacterium]